MKRFIKLIMVFIATSLLVSCSAVEIDEYQNKNPEFKINQFFNGDLVAYGMLRDRSGKVIRQFQAGLKGSWKNDEQGLLVGTLDEIFWFDDGEKQTRTWTMTPTAKTSTTNTGSNDYIGTASDVKGEAVIQSSGNAVRLAYDLIVPYKGDSLVVSMDDWMYLISPNVLINETVMTKWGFEVGKVTVMIMKVDAASDIPLLMQRYFLEKPLSGS